VPTYNYYSYCVTGPVLRSLYQMFYSAMVIDIRNCFKYVSPVEHNVLMTSSESAVGELILRNTGCYLVFPYNRV